MVRAVTREERLCWKLKNIYDLEFCYREKVSLWGFNPLLKQGGTVPPYHLPHLTASSSFTVPPPGNTWKGGTSRLLCPEDLCEASPTKPQCAWTKKKFFFPWAFFFLKILFPAIPELQPGIPEGTQPCWSDGGGDSFISCPHSPALRAVPFIWPLSVLVWRKRQWLLSLKNMNNCIHIFYWNECHLYELH